MHLFIKASLYFLAWFGLAISVHFYLIEDLIGNCATTHHPSGSIEIIDNHKVISAEVSRTSAQTITSGSTSHQTFKFDKFLQTNKNQSHVNIPDQSRLLDSFYQYLNNEQDQCIEIVSYFSINMTDSINANRLASQRVDYIKKKLTSSGINPLRIDQKIKGTDFVYDPNGNYKQGVEFNMHPLSDNQTESLKKALLRTTWHLDPFKRPPNSDKRFNAYTYELTNYLEKHPLKKLRIEGHTNHRGYFDTNYNKGLEKAIKIKEFLVDTGIPENRITAISKGESLPVVPKGTEKGLIKNNRIIIEIK